MNWNKKKVGENHKSITSDTHGMHLSMAAPDDFYITVYRKAPTVKDLGRAENFSEAIKMCEDDYNENRDRHEKPRLTRAPERG